MNKSTNEKAYEKLKLEANEWENKKNEEIIGNYNGFIYIY